VPAARSKPKLKLKSSWRADAAPHAVAAVDGRQHRLDLGKPATGAGIIVRKSAEQRGALCGQALADRHFCTCRGLGPLFRQGSEVFSQGQISLKLLIVSVVRVVRVEIDGKTEIVCVVGRGGHTHNFFFPNNFGTLTA
jgi:hypothetical protein